MNILYLGTEERKGGVRLAKEEVKKKKRKIKS